MVIGQNNDRFDNRWVNARAAKHNLFVNTFIKSFDIMKQTKRLFRLPSYSMAYIAKFFGLTLKQSHTIFYILVFFFLYFSYLLYRCTFQDVRNTPLGVEGNREEGGGQMIID